MPEVVLGFGSNFRPELALRHAAAALEAEFGAVRWSMLYRSAAQGVPAGDYLNAVAAFATTLGVTELRARLRAVEAAGGRTRRDPAVTELDLDVLFYGARVDGEQGLPRPRAFTDAFVLAPLAELVPGLVHPVVGTTAADAARRLAGGTVVSVGRVAPA